MWLKICGYVLSGGKIHGFCIFAITLMMRDTHMIDAFLLVAFLSLFPTHQDTTIVIMHHVAPTWGTGAHNAEFHVQS